MRGRVLEEVAANCFSALRVLLNLLHRPVLSEPHPLRASINKSVSKSGIFGPPPNFTTTSHKPQGPQVPQADYETLYAARGTLSPYPPYPFYPYPIPSIMSLLLLNSLEL